LHEEGPGGWELHTGGGLSAIRNVSMMHDYVQVLISEFDIKTNGFKGVLDVLGGRGQTKGGWELKIPPEGMYRQSENVSGVLRLVGEGYVDECGNR